MASLQVYVINLERRPDRLSALRKHLQHVVGWNLVVTKAIDGRDLDIDGELLRRIDTWNIENLAPNKLRSVVACALSHIQCWKEIEQHDGHWYLVLEDDARLINSRFAGRLRGLIARIPEDADIIWLNEYEARPKGGRSFRVLNKLRIKMKQVVQHLLEQISNLLGVDVVPVVFRRWRPLREKTAESYLIKPCFASELIAAIDKHLGAVDEHMRGAIIDLDAKAYQLGHPLFRQADSSDTDIQIS